MKTLLRSQDLWELVEIGVNLQDEDQARLRETRKKDAKAMAIIQQDVHDGLFSRIAAAETAKEAWDVLRIEYQGDAQVQAVKLQGLRRDFENLSMKEGEVIGDYFSRVMNIVSQKKAYGETVEDHVVVEKVLRSLTSKFDNMVPTIELSKDFKALTVAQLMGSLQSFEARINSRNSEKQEEKAFQASETMQEEKDKAFQVRYEGEFSGARGRGRSFFRGRGRGRSGRGGRGRGRYMGNVQCYTCQRYGHMSRDCNYHEQGNQVNLATEGEEENGEDDCRLFMRCIGCLTWGSTYSVLGNS